MKFEYENPNAKEPDCVALIRFIDGKVNLTIKTDEGCTILYDDETPNHGRAYDWENELENADVKFYPGDKITITF